jgi:hypothetical protein
MIHGIYIKSRPKSKWHLFSTTMSAEKATTEMKAALDHAKSEGNENAEVAIQTFESYFHIPHYLNKISDNKLMFN